MFGRNSFSGKDTRDKQLSNWNWHDEEKIFRVIKPIFDYEHDARRRRDFLPDIYIPLPALSLAFAKLRRLFPNNVLFDGAPALDDFNKTDS